MEKTNVKFSIKALSEEGTFTGLAAVYGNVDLGNDVIDRGAFTKTLADNGGQVPLLWQHDAHAPIGIARLSDSPHGLVVEGQLILADNPEARKAYALLKAGALRGLSIGYDLAKSAMSGAVRRLKELRLFEISLVTLPMNPMATVASVKDQDGPERAIAQELVKFLRKQRAPRY